MNDEAKLERISRSARLLLKLMHHESRELEFGDQVVLGDAYRRLLRDILAAESTAYKQIDKSVDKICAAMIRAETTLGKMLALKGNE